MRNDMDVLLDTGMQEITESEMQAELNLLVDGAVSAPGTMTELTADCAEDRQLIYSTLVKSLDRHRRSAITDRRTAGGNYWIKINNGSVFTITASSVESN